MASQKTPAVLDRKPVPSGTVVFREGETGSTAFIVESGQVEIWKGNLSIYLQFGSETESAKLKFNDKLFALS